MPGNGKLKFCLLLWLGLHATEVRGHLEPSDGEKCVRLLRGIASHLPQLDESDQREILNIAAQNPEVAKELAKNLLQAQALDIPVALLKLLIEKVNRPRSTSLTQEQALRMVDETMPSLPPQQRDLLVEVLCDKPKELDALTVEHFRDQLVHRVQTNIIESLSVKANQETPPPEESDTGNSREWLSNLVQNALSPDGMTKFLLEVEQSSETTRKAAMKELKFLYENGRAGRYSKKVGEGVYEVAPHGKSLKIRMLYGVYEGQVCLISGELNVKTGGGSRSKRQNEWIAEAEMTWKAFVAQKELKKKQGNR